MRAKSAQLQIAPQKGALLSTPEAWASCRRQRGGFKADLAGRPPDHSGWRKRDRPDALGALAYHYRPGGFKGAQGAHFLCHLCGVEVLGVESRIPLPPFRVHVVFLWQPVYPQCMRTVCVDRVSTACVNSVATSAPRVGVAACVCGHVWVAGSLAVRPIGHVTVWQCACAVSLASVAASAACRLVAVWPCVWRSAAGQCPRQGVHQRVRPFVKVVQNQGAHLRV